MVLRGRVCYLVNHAMAMTPEYKRVPYQKSFQLFGREFTKKTRITFGQPGVLAPEDRNSFTVRRPALPTDCLFFHP